MDEGFGGGEVLEVGEFLFPVADDEAFELGAVVVGEVAF